MTEFTEWLRGIEIIFFDFDGVLVESNEVKIDAFRRLYEPHGQEIVEKVLKEHVRHEGISRVVKLERFHRDLLNIELDETGLAELAEIYSGMVEDAVCSCDPVPGSLDAIAAWRERCPLYVVSGTPQDELRRIADHRGMTDWFAQVYGSPRLKADIVGEVLSERGVTPDKALFVGDSLTDYDAAQATGTHFLGRVAPWRNSPFPEGTKIAEDLQPLAGAARRPGAAQ